MKPLLWPRIIGCLLALAVLAADAPVEKTHKLTTISPRKFADCLHAVIAADREVYSRLVVERLTAEPARLRASEDGRREDCLPVHAQMLRTAGANIQKKGAEFSYALRSLWPINPSHGPQTEVEQTGLEFVAKHRGTNFYTDEMLGGRSYFTAIYADVASLPSCVTCHNQHPASPRRDFKTNDVMGAIVVRAPLEF
jgi:alkylhydroperoxidase family enzyme